MWLSFRIILPLLTLASFSLAQVVREIRVEGAEYVPEDVILGLINIRRGSLYSPDMVRESIRRMYRTGFFDKVEVYEERIGEDVVLKAERENEKAETRVLKTRVVEKT